MIPGTDAVLFAYGPVMLHEALIAAEILEQSNFSLQVNNLPWLNRFDSDWLAATVEPHRHIYVLEDHTPSGGLADHLLNNLNTLGLLNNRRFHKFAVEGYPACGTPQEVPRQHGLDGASSPS